MMTQDAEFFSESRLAALLALQLTPLCAAYHILTVLGIVSQWIFAMLGALLLLAVYKVQYKVLAHGQKNNPHPGTKGEKNKKILFSVIFRPTSN